jgi:hypothetical protein
LLVTRSVRLIALVVAAGALCAIAPALGTADPAVHAAGKCKLTSKEQRGLGPTYVTSLSVTHVSCKSGKALVKAYYKCRAKNGPSGRCVKKVSGYSCRETRSGISVQFNAKVTCTNGRKVVKHSYTQNT